MKTLLAFFALLGLAWAQTPTTTLQYNSDRIVGTVTAGAQILPGQLLKPSPNTVGISQYIPATTSDTQGVVAISETESQQAGYSVQVRFFGFGNILADGPCTVGQPMIISPNINGDAECVSQVGTSQVVGTAMASTTVAGPVLALSVVFGPPAPNVTATHFTDFPSKMFIPSALCNNATPATTFSLPTSNAPTPTCDTGTNTQVGSLNFADGQTAQATYYLPDDWDSSSSVDSKVFFSSSSTSGTVIFQLAATCTNVNGTQTDDQAFNSAVSYSTVTLNSTANAVWSASLTGLTMTNCSAGELLHLKLSRATDTAADTGVAVRGVSLTVRRTF